MQVTLTKKERDHVHKIAEKQGGHITPDDIIADAKKKSSPLHKRFQWDVEKAAMEHWRSVARSIIRSVKVNVTVDSRSVEAVAYVRDPAASKEGKQGYYALTMAQDSEADTASVIASELGRAEGVLNRVLNIASALEKEEDVREALRLVVGVRQHAEAQKPAREAKRQADQRQAAVA